MKIKKCSKMQTFVDQLVLLLSIVLFLFSVYVMFWVIGVPILTYLETNTIAILSFVMILAFSTLLFYLVIEWIVCSLFNLLSPRRADSIKNKFFFALFEKKEEWYEMPNGKWLVYNHIKGIVKFIAFFVIVLGINIIIYHFYVDTVTGTELVLINIAPYVATFVLFFIYHEKQKY